MAKSKYAPALFEVINARQDAKSGNSKLSLPKWWKRESSAPSADDAETPEEIASPAQLPAVEVHGPQPEAPVVRLPEPPAQVHQAAEDEFDPPPMLEVRAGRLALSLNPVSAAIVAGVALIALFTSYQLGYRSGRSASAIKLSAATPPTDELTKAITGPARPEVIKSAASPRPRNAAQAAPPRPAAAQPTPGNTARQSTATPSASPSAGPARYVVLENFRTDRDSAEFAQKWLAEHGYNTRLEKRGDAWRLLSANPFEDQAQADRYIEAVREIGKQLSRALSTARLPNYDMRAPMQVTEK